MLHDHTPLIRWSLKGMFRLGCFPLVWDGKTGRTQKIRSKRRLLVSKGVELVHLLYFVVAAWTTISESLGSCKLSHLLISILMVLFNLILQLWGMGAKLAFKAGTLINSVLDFEVGLQRKFKSEPLLTATTRTGRSRYISKILKATNITAPIMTIMRGRRLYGNYCHPAFMGHLLRYCDQCGKYVPLPMTLSWLPYVVLVFDVYQIGSMVFKAFFNFFVVNLAVTGAILDYLDWLKTLGETGNRSTTGLSTRIQTYRCLQVLEKQLNAFASPRVIPTLMVVGPMIEVYCSFLVIKMGHVLPAQGFMTYPMAIGIITTALIVYETFAAQLFVKSEELMRIWQKEVGSGQGLGRWGKIARLHRKEIRSLQPLRVRLQAGFIDRGTALVTQDMCINQIVSLLLM